jgi:hypothetical protein
MVLCIGLYFLARQPPFVSRHTGDAPQPTWEPGPALGGPRQAVPNRKAGLFATVIMVASLIAILDLKGKPLIQRSYRDDVHSSAIEKFLPLVLDIEEEGQQVTPCLSSQGINFMHIRHSNLYRPSFFLTCSEIASSLPFSVLALSKRNTNAAEVIIFLHRLVSVLIEYFKELEEESIRDNFVIIYELMDEMMDFGYPQTTESKILQECVSNSPCMVTSLIYLLIMKVYHTGIAQTRDSGAPTDGSHKCRFMADGGNQVSEERSLFGRH